MSAFATVAPRVARKSFNGKFTAKMIFRSGIFMLLDAVIETLFEKYLDHILMKCEQNRMVKNVINFELFGRNGWPFFRKR